MFQLLLLREVSRGWSGHVSQLLLSERSQELTSQRSRVGSIGEGKMSQDKWEAEEQQLIKTEERQGYDPQRKPSVAVSEMWSGRVFQLLLLREVS